MTRPSSLMSEDSARTLGEERAALLSKANTLPRLPKRQAYRLIRKGEGEGHDPIDIVARHGAAFVYADASATRTWYTVCDACGLALAFRMYKRRNAVALAKAIGPKADAYFERAAKGDRFAASAVARLCRIYMSRDARED
jgi:hypothetical protein